jgi:outer membrane protein assembly factor BamB
MPHGACLCIQNKTVYAGLYGTLFALDWETGERKWTTTHDTVFSPATTDQYVYTRTGSDISAVNTDSGKLIWQFTASPEDLVSPVVAGDVLYTGEYVADQVQLFAIDAYSGEVRWKRSGPEDLYGLIVASGKLIAICGHQIAAFE